MAIAFLLSLTLLVLAEIALFVVVGDAIGVWRTVALVFVSMMAGIFVLRIQGVVTLLRVRDALQRGEPPTAELFDGACFLAAGILLIIPGFLTDIVALLLLLPPVRDLLRRSIRARVFGRTDSQVRGGPVGGSQGQGGRKPGGPGPVIEGEFEEVPTRENGESSGRLPDRGDEEGEPRR